MTDHYRTLGILPSATAAEIRTAYLSLMKLYHPDALSRDRAEDAEAKAQELNRAYAVLRDQERRAAYDSERQLKAAALVASPSRTRPPVVLGEAFPTRRPRRPSRLGRAAALGLVAAAVGVLLGVLVSGGPGILPREAFPELAAKEEERHGPTVPQPPIDSRLVIDAGSDAEFIFLRGIPEDAVMFSRSCFQELAQMPTLKLLDRCVAFDLASSRWIAITKNGHQTNYFSPPFMADRHAKAFEKLAFAPAARQERLRNLDQLSVTEIALRLNQP